MKLFSRVMTFVILLVLVFMAIYIIAILVNGRVVISDSFTDDDFVPLPVAGPAIISIPSVAPCSTLSPPPVEIPGIAAGRYPGGDPCDE
ncbi:MAG: hypothetical protein HGA79_07955 [Anaerolineales bacterium]|jgi:hypothetical protein|nr:hypothetical protein [Anaerolineales bacterium]